MRGTPPLRDARSVVPSEAEAVVVILIVAARHSAIGEHVLPLPGPWTGRDRLLR